MQLTDIISTLFVSNRKAAKAIGEGMTLMIDPGVTFRLCRASAYPSVAEINTIISDAKKVGVKLYANPELKSVTTALGTEWLAAEWSLEDAEVVKL